MRYISSLSLVLAVLTLTACGPRSAGPHVRFSQASAADLEAAAQSNQIIWYDFEPGDEVPIILGLVGIAQAVSEPPARMIARRHFSIVVFPDGRTFFSFDGERLVSGEQLARWNITLEPAGQGGGAVLLMFIGQAQDMPEGMR